MITRTLEKIDWYKSSFELFEKSLNGSTTSPVHGLRREAIARFSELGFPTTKNEEWRFTNVSPIVKESFAPVFAHVEPGVTSDDVVRFSFGGLECSRLVFINGHFAKGLSTLVRTPLGMIIGSIAAVLRTDSHLANQHLGRYARFVDNAFTALNTAFLQDGAFVYVPDNQIVEEPIHLVFISTGTRPAIVSHPRILVVAGKQSRLSIVESYVSLDESRYLTNAVTEIVLGDGAVVEHDKLQLESSAAFHVGTIHVYQNQKSNYTSNSISLGGALVRNNVTSVLNAEGCECTLNGLSLATGQQLVDNHTTIDHAKPNCVSHELYKAILDGKSRGVFNGRIFVRKDAQKTDAKQTNRTLLLSDDAMIDTKPQLEIFADDVKCTHGAAVGQLDEEQVFYLRSRGLGLAEARDILTFAFASDVISRVHIDPLREQLDGMIQSRLREGRRSEN